MSILQKNREVFTNKVYMYMVYLLWKKQDFSFEER